MRFKGSRAREALARGFRRSTANLRDRTVSDSLARGYVDASMHERAAALLLIFNFNYPPR